MWLACWVIHRLQEAETQYSRISRHSGPRDRKGCLAKGPYLLRQNGQRLEIRLILPDIKAACNSKSKFRLMPYHVSSKHPSWRKFGKCNFSFLFSGRQAKGGWNKWWGSNSPPLCYPTSIYTLLSIIKLLDNNLSHNSMHLPDVMSLSLHKWKCTYLLPKRKDSKSHWSVPPPLHDMHSFSNTDTILSSYPVAWGINK